MGPLGPGALRLAAKGLATLAVAFFMSAALVVAIQAAFDDALRDFLDDQSRTAVNDYLRRTEAGRIFGAALGLCLWTVTSLTIVWMIDLLCKPAKGAKPSERAPTSDGG